MLMSATDRLATLESNLTGRNAWRTGWQWADRNRARNRARIRAHADGSPRALPLPLDHAVRLTGFSNTLCGRHRSLLSHIRDHAPLKRDDPMSDLMIAMCRGTDPTFMRRLPDDPQGFRDLWTLSLDWPDSAEYTIIGQRRGESLLDEADTRRCHEWACTVMDAMGRWRADIEKWSGHQFTLDGGGVIDMPLMMLRDDNPWEEATLPHGLRIRLNPDSYDWRTADPTRLHATLETSFPDRLNDGHLWDEPRWLRSPEQLAHTVGRLLSDRQRKRR